MTQAAARAPKTKRTRKTAAKGPLPWWGDYGPAPHEKWPGVTIEFPAVWNAKRKRWESPDGRYYFDMRAADLACKFFPTFLKHHIGEFAGEPFELRDDQAQLIVRPVFGWKRASDGLRRIRKLFAFCPKGYGKSPLGAGLGILLARCDNEPAAEVYAVAADKNQAKVVHENAKVMVEADEDLLEDAEIYTDAIVWKDTRSVYKVLSADASTKHGFRPHGIIFDEFHAQPNRNLYEALKKSMPKRRQPLMVLITHAGDDDEGICYEEYEYARNVLKGKFDDDTCLPVIFEASPDDDWTAEETWRKVNPGYGVTVKADAIAAECREAINEPRKKNDFLRFHLNRWVNQAVSWIPVDWWDKCDEPLPPVAELANYPVAIGIDNAQKIDLASAVAVFRLPLERKDGDDAVEVVSVDEAGNVQKRRVSLNYRIAIVPRFWLPEETLVERSRQDGIPYDIYRDAGLLEVTEGAIIDSQAIVDYIKRDPPTQDDLVAQFPLLKQGEIGYDPAFATEIAIRLASRGLKTVEVLQNYKHLSEACQVFEALVKSRRVIHGGHRLLRWNLENVAIKRDDAGRIRMVKPRNNSKKRIDGIVATVIALSRLMVMPMPRKRSGGALVWTPTGFVPASGPGDSLGAGDAAQD